MTAIISAKALEELLKATPFNRLYGFRIVSAKRGSCTLRVPYCADFERPDGIIGGHAFMTAADVAMWLAIATRLGTEERAVTVEMKTNFLRSLRRAPFQCRARVLKVGRQLVYGTAVCSEHSTGILTHHTLTYIRLPRG